MNILFVCTGNTCRSPMAEGIARDLAEKNKLNITVKSMGIYGIDGDKVSKNAIKAMDDINIDIKNHRSSSINTKLIEEADLILTMGYSHKIGLLSLYPTAREKVFLLNEFAFKQDKDIQDPFGGKLEDYIRARDEIYKGVEEVIGKIIANN